MSDAASRERTAVLDPVERVSEVVFGVLMALTFTGSLSVSAAGSGEIHTMMLAALGCNLAWGLTDAVMYLVGTTTERHRRAALLRRLRDTVDVREAHRMIADALPERFASSVGDEGLEALRRGLVAGPARSPGLGARDYAGALGVFVLVVLATFPVVIPFLFIGETSIALRVSNLLALATLFIGGYLLGRYAGGPPWRWGIAMATVGTVLVVSIIALGG
jgi:VIT1/CCC1 family predicted Fe2+/Mn2+ transporter